VRGVVAVANELEVHLPASSRRDDTVIADALARTLTHAITPPPGSVRATVRKGAVTLDGAVTWSFQREAAERIARRVPGVTGISNRITVADGALSRR
jgi:osmotically-inducible protein OsmY